MRLLLSAVALGVASAGRGTPDHSLFEVRPMVSPGNFSLFKSYINDDDQLESLSEERAQVWGSVADVKALEALGFDVQTEGVVDESHLNWLDALQTNYTHQAGQEPAWNVYCDYTCLTSRLQSWSTQICPGVFQLSSIGRTVRDRDIWVVRATTATSPTAPEVLMAGNIHGDEVVGGQLVQRLLWNICTNPTNTRTASILRNNVLFFLPMFNADGYQNNLRGNANGVDLNRNFPNTWTSNNDLPTGRQVETVALMNFVRQRNFAISLMYHGGAEVVNYAYDGRQPGTSGYSATRKDRQAIAVSRAYANAHRTMAQSRTFPGGIVNGAVWYVIYGSHQDHMYDFRRECIDLTLEVSNVKRPAAGTLPGFWTDNENAMWTFLESAPLAA